MTYGVPYQGSKNRLAQIIMERLPSGKRFVDLFAGGCAMTQAALASGKYDCALTNDKFWEWARTRDYPVYVSEYSAPDDFVSIMEKSRSGIQDGCGKAKNTTHIEHLFIHRRFA